MTYEDFLTTHKARQLEYIESERERIGFLDQLRLKFAPDPYPRGEEPLAYKNAALQLGLHPLQTSEIIERQRELDHMEASNVGADTPNMRLFYSELTPERIEAWDKSCAEEKLKRTQRADAFNAIDYFVMSGV